MNSPVVRGHSRGIIAATLCMNAGLAAFAAGAPVAQNACGHSERTVAIAAALSSLAAVCGALLAGRGTLGGRRGWLVAMLTLLVGAGVCVVVAVPDAPSWSIWLVPLRLLDGLALGVALVASETLLLAHTNDASRGRALALYAMATAAGFIAGPAIASIGIELGGVGAAFVVAAVVGFAAFVVVLVGVRDVAIMSTTTAAATTTATTTATTWSILWRRNVVPWSTTFHYGAFQGAALVLLPLRLLADGIDEAAAVAIVAFYALGMLVCTYPSTRLGERFGPLKVLKDAGFSTIIWANHLMRSALVAMQKTAARIFADQDLLAVEGQLGQVAPLAEVFRLQGQDELEAAEKRYLPATAQKARAVVLAASRGKELGDLTLDKPKCMLPLAGVPILQRIVSTFQAAGMRDVAVVRGYKKETVVVTGISTFDNDAHDSTAEVGSLLAARAVLSGSVVVSYGDVIFQPHVIDSLCGTDDDVVIAVDPGWRNSRNRGERSADLVRCSRASTRDSFLHKTMLIEVPNASVDSAHVEGAHVEGEIHGEWIGVLKLSPRGTEKLLAVVDENAAAGVDVLQWRVPELLRAMRGKGHDVRVLYTAGTWIDVDTVEDLGEAAP